MNWLHVERRDSPLILTFPHGGTDIPGEYAAAFTSSWHAQRDADWHIRALYDGLVDATFVSTDISRSVIDCNRPPDGASLYPGQATTGLCPIEDFDGAPLYRAGEMPGVAARRDAYHAPYHAALQGEIERLRASHDHILVYDCHSIRSHIPRLFEGELPELNIGTDNGRTCAPQVSDAVIGQCQGRSHVLNGRFRGGWTTRHYGNPEAGVHAVQMEIAMRAYLHEPEGAPDPGNWPPPFDPGHAAPLRRDLTHILEAAVHSLKALA